MWRGRGSVRSSPAEEMDNVQVLGAEVRLVVRKMTHGVIDFPNHRALGLLHQRLTLSSGNCSLFYHGIYCESRGGMKQSEAEIVD